jgi:hypothetical protein
MASVHLSAWNLRLIGGVLINAVSGRHGGQAQSRAEAGSLFL